MASLGAMSRADGWTRWLSRMIVFGACAVCASSGSCSAAKAPGVSASRSEGTARARRTFMRLPPCVLGCWLAWNRRRRNPAGALLDVEPAADRGHGRGRAGEGDARAGQVGGGPFGRPGQIDEADAIDHLVAVEGARDVPEVGPAVVDRARREAVEESDVVPAFRDDRRGPQDGLL